MIVSLNISIITFNISYVTISPEIKIKEQQAIKFVSTRGTAGYRLFSFECAQDTQAQSESSSLIRRCEREFLRDFLSEFRLWSISLQLLNQINSVSPEVLYVSLLFPG